MKKAKQTQTGTRRLAALSLLVLLAAGLLVAAPASAFETRSPLPFSPITAGSGFTVENTGGIAVEEATGNVFLADIRGTFADESGSFIDLFGADGGAPAGLASPFQIGGFSMGNVGNPAAWYNNNFAIDQSGASPNQGTLYVKTNNNSSATKIEKFTRNPTTERYEASGVLETAPPQLLVKPAVDGKGDVYAGTNISGQGLIVKFDPTGTEVKPRISLKPLNRGTNNYVIGGLAVDSGGDVFMLGVRSGNLAGYPETIVVKYPVNGSGVIDANTFTILYEGKTNGANRPTEVESIAVDPVTDTLFLLRYKDVLQYDAETLALEGEFGAGEITNPMSIAVNGATNRVYISDNAKGYFPGSVNAVLAFGPGVKLPSVRAKDPTGVIGPRATLNAVFNAEGLAISDCHFEYVSEAQFQIDGFVSATPIPCEGATPPDSADHPVTAQINDLTPGGVKYRFRVSATNANGEHSDEGSFLSGPPAITETATNVTGAKATLHGTVLPQGEAVTECKFEYGTDTTYGSTVPCEESVPADNGEHAVSAQISHLLPNGTTYHFRVYLKTAAAAEGQDETLTTKDTFTTEAATAISGNGATLNGTVKLEGDSLTDCYFEYGLDSSYGQSTPCSPVFSAIPDDSTEHAVSGAVSGLTPNTEYHFRLVAQSAIGEITGENFLFKSLGKPVIGSQSASPTGTEQALLEAEVNPGGLDTSYQFEYGTDSSYGNTAPAGLEGSAGSGTDFTTLSEPISGLQPNTIYHYRVLATSSLGTTTGPDQTFATPVDPSTCANAEIREDQTSTVNPNGTAYLPDCMGLELVSPPKKYNQFARFPMLSDTGDAVGFESLAALGDTPLLEIIFNHYVAVRAGTGWTTHAVQPPMNVAEESGVCTYTADLSRWSAYGADPNQRGGGSTVVTVGGVSSPFMRLSPMLYPLNFGNEAIGGQRCEGSSADLSKVFFAIKVTSYVAGDPVPSTQQFNVYEAYRDENGQPSVRLINRDKAGQVWGGTCGAHVGAGLLGGGGAYRGSVSTDGDRVYFTTRPDQPLGSACDNNLGNRVMVRSETPDGPEISVLSASECSRVAPPCSASDGDDTFQSASLEGNQVFFMTTRQLANSDLDTGSKCGAGVSSSVGCDLYRYDASRPEGERLTQLSRGEDGDPTPGEGADVLGVADISGDGSHVYFVAAGVLTSGTNQIGDAAEAGKPNLYLYERDAAHPGGHVIFIATLESGDSSDWSKAPGGNKAAAVPLLGSNLADQSVGGDGHVLVFSSKAPLTPDDTDGGEDVYRYDALTGSLQRISRAAPGGSDNGPLGVEFTPYGVFPGPQSAFEQRSVSEDGETIVFATKEALDPDETSGGQAFVWRNGQITGIAGSNALGSGYRPTVSATGNEVAFVSAEPLVSTDGDGTNDVYVARADGGFVTPTVTECKGEACQNPSGALPAHPTIASGEFQGPGNIKVKPTPGKRCRKGTRKVKHHGKQRCAPRKHAKANRRVGR